MIIHERLFETWSSCGGEILSLQIRGLGPCFVYVLPLVAAILLSVSVGHVGFFCAQTGIKWSLYSFVPLGLKSRYIPYICFHQSSKLLECCCRWQVTGTLVWFLGNLRHYDCATVPTPRPLLTCERKDRPSIIPQWSEAGSVEICSRCFFQRAHDKIYDML